MHNRGIWMIELMILLHNLKNINLERENSVEQWYKLFCFFWTLFDFFAHINLFTKPI